MYVHHGGKARRRRGGDPPLLLCDSLSHRPTAHVEAYIWDL